jgi:N-acetyl-gamma-glutamyl-phosphate reductase
MSYGVAGHRHHPEIVQELSRIAGSPVGLVFTPHLVPMIRGMQSTIYARITKEADFQKLFEEAYAGEPFVDVMPPGSVPDTRSVRGANTCRLAIHRPQNGDTLMVLSVIDNLTKGAAGQAVQAMNIMCGLPETAGLEGIGLVP